VVNTQQLAAAYKVIRGTISGPNIWDQIQYLFAIRRNTISYPSIGCREKLVHNNSSDQG